MNPLTPIYYLGPQHSFHHILARRLFGDTPALTAVADITTLGKLLSENPQATGILAIHNTTAGYLAEHYALIADCGLFIRQQAQLQIHLHLCGLPGSNTESIQTIGSHRIALQQCIVFLETLPTRQIEYRSTTEAMQQVVRNNDPTFAAIGNLTAAKEYGLNILSGNIEDKQDNVTRFAVLSKEIPHTTKTPLNASIWLPFSAIPLANLLMSKNHMQVLGNLTLPQHHAVIMEIAINQKLWGKVEEELMRMGAVVIGLYGESILYNEF